MLRAVAFLDLSTFTATYVRSYKEELKDDASYAGAQTVHLRSADADLPVLKEWRSARALLQRLRNEAAPFLGGKPAVLGRAFIVSLKPQAFTDWQRHEDAYSLEHMRLIVPMIPSPGYTVFSGGVGLNPPVGQVTFVDVQNLHSEINLGLCACANLVVDVRRSPED